MVTLPLTLLLDVARIRGLWVMLLIVILGSCQRLLLFVIVLISLIRLIFVALIKIPLRGLMVVTVFRLFILVCLSSVLVTWLTLILAFLCFRLMILTQRRRVLVVGLGRVVVLVIPFGRVFNIPYLSGVRLIVFFLVLLSLRFRPVTLNKRSFSGREVATLRVTVSCRRREQLL